MFLGGEPLASIYSGTKDDDSSLAIDTSSPHVLSVSQMSRAEGLYQVQVTSWTKSNSAYSRNSGWASCFSSKTYVRLRDISASIPNGVRRCRNSHRVLVEFAGKKKTGIVPSCPFQIQLPGQDVPTFQPSVPSDESWSRIVLSDLKWQVSSVFHEIMGWRKVICPFALTALNLTPCRLKQGSLLHYIPVSLS